MHAIPREQLNATDQVAYDVFDYSTKDTLRGLQPDMLALTAVRPMNHFFGFHTFYPTFASGKGAAPFKTLVDYENNLKRHHEFVTYIDRAIGRFREGEKSGAVETKMTVRNMIEQLDNQLKMKPEDSPYYGPVKQFPAGINDADKTRLTQQYRAAVTDEIYPALTRLRDFFKTEYLAKADEWQKNVESWTATTNGPYSDKPYYLRLDILTLSGRRIAFDRDGRERRCDGVAARMDRGPVAARRRFRRRGPSPLACAGRGRLSASRRRDRPDNWRGRSSCHRTRSRRWDGRNPAPCPRAARRVIDLRPLRAERRDHGDEAAHLAAVTPVRAAVASSR